MNKVILMGYVGRNPEQRGEKVVSLSLGTTERGYTTAEGKKVEARTEWHTLKIFDPKLASFALAHIKKGNTLVVEGSIHYSDYTDKDGNKRQGVDIVVSQISFAPRSR